MSSAQSAHRSVTTMIKDAPDQTLVTMTDAEHMYARRDLELDKPLTAHGIVPMSIRSYKSAGGRAPARTSGKPP